jgi:hypothetical protein
MRPGVTSVTTRPSVQVASTKLRKVPNLPTDLVSRSDAWAGSGDRPSPHLSSSVHRTIDGPDGRAPPPRHSRTGRVAVDSGDDALDPLLDPGWPGCGPDGAGSQVSGRNADIIDTAAADLRERRHRLERALGFRFPGPVRVICRETGGGLAARSGGSGPFAGKSAPARLSRYCAGFYQNGAAQHDELGRSVFYLSRCPNWYSCWYRSLGTETCLRRFL